MIDNFKMKIILEKLKDIEVLNIIFEEDLFFDEYSLLTTVFFKYGDFVCCRNIYIDSKTSILESFDIDNFCETIREMIVGVKKSELFYLQEGYVFDTPGFLRIIYINDFCKSLVNEISSLATCGFIQAKVDHYSSKISFNQFIKRVSQLVENGLSLKEIHIGIIKEEGFDSKDVKKALNYRFKP